jgi:hypothetical protein
MKASDFHPKWQTLLVVAAVQILFAACVAARAANVEFYLVAKGHEYIQSSPAPPAPKRAAAEFSFSAKYATNSDLDAAFPDGNYQMVIQAAHDGTKAITLPLNGDVYPATVPSLNNFTAAQAINSSAKYTLSWPAFSGGTANDIILVTISDITGITLFNSPDPGQPGSLNGTNTSFVIPPNTLPGGSLFGGSLIFAKVVKRDTTSYTGVPGFALYYTQTHRSSTLICAHRKSACGVFRNQRR